MTLDSRIAKLETKLLPKAQTPVHIFVCWASQGGQVREFQRLRHGTRQWDRMSDETEERFKARAIREAGSNAPMALFFAD